MKLVCELCDHLYYDEHMTHAICASAHLPRVLCGNEIDVGKTYYTHEKIKQNAIIDLNVVTCNDIV